jgi:hypothetical protein
MCTFLLSYNSVSTLGSRLQCTLKAIVRKEQELAGTSSHRQDSIEFCMPKLIFFEGNTFKFLIGSHKCAKKLAWGYDIPLLILYPW